MDRRTFIKGAVISAATPGVVASGDGVEHSTLLALIARHENLYAADDRAWGRVYDLDDSAMMQAPRPMVQLGRLRVGQSDDRQPVFEPITAESEHQVVSYYEDHFRYLDMLYRGTRPDLRADAFAKHEQRKQAKLSEFRECVAVRKRYEDDCGYTAAMAAARASMEEVKEVERLIIAYVPASLEEAATKARWMVKKMSDDKSYLNDYENALEEALDAIGRA